jgi:hypothetical protein
VERLCGLPDLVTDTLEDIRLLLKEQVEREREIYMSVSQEYIEVLHSREKELCLYKVVPIP